MSIRTQTNILYDGERRAVVQGTGITIDGAAPNNLTLATLVDLSVLVPEPSSVRIDSIEGDVDYGVVELFWEGVPPVSFAILSGSRLSFNYDNIGGMVMPPECTGNILISTTGFNLTSTYMLKLNLTKRVT